MTYIPGYIASVSFNGTQVEQDATNCALTKTTSLPDTTTLGVVDTTLLPGLKGGTLACSLHLNNDEMVALEAANASTVPITFSFRAGSAGIYDAGIDSGLCNFDSFDKTGGFDDNWNVDIAATITGPVLFTPPV